MVAKLPDLSTLAPLHRVPVQTIVVVAAVVSCLFWWFVSWRFERTRRAVVWLDQQRPPEPSRWPLVSLIVPACNEALTLRRAVASRLNDDYPNLEMVLIDDRSTDESGRLIDELASRDRRVTAIHLTELPEGWLGKLNALQQGTAKAAGDWFLFSDADVEFAPGTLRSAVAYSEARGLDHLVAMPRFLPAGAILDAAIDTFISGMMADIDFAKVEDPRSRAAIGSGVFSMVRRAALERTAGFEWLKLEVADDVALGQMLKRVGARQAMVNASRQVSLHWYKTLGEMAQGMEKNSFAILGRYRVGWLLLSCGLILLLSLGPLAGLFLAKALWLRGLCAVTLVVGIVARMRFNHWAVRSLLPVLLFPLGTLLIVAMALRAGILTVWRGGVVWRGTLYPTEQLRANMRLEVF